MLTSADVLTTDLHRLATTARPDQLEPATRALLAEVPLRAQVLDIHCGTGALARELATKRGARVTAIDIAPRLIDTARLRTSQTLRVDYRVADIMALTPRGFDIAIAVDALTDLPLAEIVDRMATAVVPGGKVLISDRFTARGLGAAPYNFLSSLKGERPTDEPLAYGPIRTTLREVLPGVAVRRHLGWRYTAIWTKP
jgi:SAM-dependent methyltransferase